MNLEVERLREAHAKWALLAEQGNTSVPREAGYVAIVSSAHLPGYDTQPPDEESGRYFDQFTAFHEDASDHAKYCTDTGRKVELIEGASYGDMEAILRDERCTDVILIGNGSYRSFMLPGQSMTWWNASQTADHLKLGMFYQRTCGHFNDFKLNVALGTFVVANLRNIWAATGKLIEDRHPNPNYFRPVYGRSYHTADELIRQAIDRIKINK